VSFSTITLCVASQRVVVVVVVVDFVIHSVQKLFHTPSYVHNVNFDLFERDPLSLNAIFRHCFKCFITGLKSLYT